ncbi:MAG: hypothetical protein A2675_02280 [Candidatus Yonathbacteria bacterium RIFCSPHIGHO2_01_FULL_51_10]|uniref:Glucanase n=1 Tax=Candidatus Yonathbacteria bacterium RIFCSPHIGHO2_01_FULL_51_10 TaxID=1802723 RepID=A0A1G2S722_9BACT|nr:MAG: hypothetical protein A2675_02280 [Candidatus Yonathbacteria bacterium RIFCSPHIGHO2_01_FULL_51_10]
MVKFVLSALGIIVFAPLFAVSAATTVETSTISAEYAAWKAAFVVQSGAKTDELRVRDPRSEDATVSEGQGYGMLLAVLNDDRATFDALWRYAERNRNERGLMNWKIDRNGTVVGKNGATDADEDISYALLLATHKWGDAYASQAHAYIDAVYTYEVEPNTYVLKPGDVWGGSDATNPSYYAPTYYREFAQFTGNSGWMRVNDKAYEILFLARHPTTGLIPEWTTANGTSAARITWNNSKDDFSYNAIRIPWRIGADFVENGDPRAYEILSQINAFFEQTASPTSGYTLDGQPTTSYLNTTFASGIAAASVVSKDPLYRANAENTLKTMQSTDYYGASLRVLTLAFINRAHANESAPSLPLPPITIVTPVLPVDQTPPVSPQNDPVVVVDTSTGSAIQATSSLPVSGDIPSTLPVIGSKQITVIHPYDGGTISGEKKLKVFIEGLPLSAYTATYSVDGRTAVPMTNSMKHKQSKVLFDDWTWSGNGPYRVTFTANDAVTGAVLGSTSITLFVKH